MFNLENISAFFNYSKRIDAIKTKAFFDGVNQSSTPYNSDFADETLSGSGSYGRSFLKNYKASIGTYQKLLDQYPDFAKNPEALLGLANAQIQLSLIPEAKKSLQDLIKKYPQSDLIKNAQKRLKVLDSIKP